MVYYINKGVDYMYKRFELVLVKLVCVDVQVPDIARYNFKKENQKYRRAENDRNLSHHGTFAHASRADRGNVRRKRSHNRHSRA